MIDRTVTTVIDAERCTGCGLCVEICPAGTISLQGEKAVVTGDRSLSCGHCAAVCPAEAITVRAIDPEAVAVRDLHRRSPLAPAGGVRYRAARPPDGLPALLPPFPGAAGGARPAGGPRQDRRHGPLGDELSGLDLHDPSRPGVGRGLRRPGRPVLPGPQPDGGKPPSPERAEAPRQAGTGRLLPELPPVGERGPRRAGEDRPGPPLPRGDGRDRRGDEAGLRAPPRRMPSWPRRTSSLPPTPWGWGAA